MIVRGDVSLVQGALIRDVLEDAGQPRLAVQGRHVVAEVEIIRGAALPVEDHHDECP